MEHSEDIPKEFTRPQVVEIIRYAISAINADQARSLGPAYLLEKFEERERQKEQKPVLSDQES
jgi:hypothetical protein